MHCTPHSYTSRNTTTASLSLVSSLSSCSLSWCHPLVDAPLLGLAPRAVLYVPYIVLEIPSNLVLKRFGPARWIPGLVATWGLGACACRVRRDEFARLFLTCYLISIFFLQSLLSRASSRLVRVSTLTVLSLVLPKLESCPAWRSISLSS